MSGELTVDLVWMVRPRPFYWPAVVLGMAVGAALGLWGGNLVGDAVWFFVLSGTIVFGGLGMNVGVDFFLLALSPSQLYLVDSSRVTSRPVRRARLIDHDAITRRSGALIERLTIDGRRYVTGRSYRARLDRMLEDSGRSSG